MQRKNQSRKENQVKEHSHEVMPLNNLSPSGSIASSECLGKHDSTKGISSSVSTVGIHFTTIVTSLDVDLSLVDETDYLDIGRSSCELDTF